MTELALCNIIFVFSPVEVSFHGMIFHRKDCLMSISRIVQMPSNK